MPISKWDTAPNNVHYSIEALGINAVNSIIGFQGISYGIIATLISLITVEVGINVEGVQKLQNH